MPMQVRQGVCQCRSVRVCANGPFSGLSVIMRTTKTPKSGACCHHGLLEDLAVTKMTKKWRMLSPWAARGHRGDKNAQKVAHVVTMGC